MATAGKFMLDFFSNSFSNHRAIYTTSLCLCFNTLKIKLTKLKECCYEWIFCKAFGSENVNISFLDRILNRKIAHSIRKGGVQHEWGGLEPVSSWPSNSSCSNYLSDNYRENLWDKDKRYNINFIDEMKYIHPFPKISHYIVTVCISKRVFQRTQIWTSAQLWPPVRLQYKLQFNCKPIGL